ncbi:hypothetical protein [Nonlabens dokdonensis]|uniref:DUF6943 family protein n=1 Tax=Nonlabens dokdonensis TaxID=328515 RepID=UPI0026EDFA3F|nr:hypothetical protein [Nonlabens dokdonensis]
MKYSIHSKPRSSSRTHFFIQSHGHHAGRPLKDPIPNSFTIELEDSELLHTAFYTCKMLYQSKALYPLQRGSVIPFIALYEYKKVFARALRTTMKDCEKFAKIATALDHIEKRIDINLQENKTLREMELAMLAQYRI